MALIAGVLLFTIVELSWLMVIGILLADRRVWDPATPRFPLRAA